MKLYRTIVATAIALAYIFVVGYLSSLFVAPTNIWYLALEKPLFTPNSTVFEIVWIICYVLIGICVTVSIVQKPLRKTLVPWAIIGIFNVVWCAVFFNIHLTYLGLAVLLVQVVALAVTANFYIHNNSSLWIAIIPLLVWYTYAFVLNFCIVIMN